jgi:serine/threonine protein kinase
VVHNVRISTYQPIPEHRPKFLFTAITKWVRGDLLGKGTYGLVYLALDTSSGEMFAVKQVGKGNKDANYLKFVPELKMEGEILSGLHHPHIVAYLGSEETATSLSLYVVLFARKRY